MSEARGLNVSPPAVKSPSPVPVATGNVKPPMIRPLLALIEYDSPSMVTACAPGVIVLPLISSPLLLPGRAVNVYPPAFKTGKEFEG